MFNFAIKANESWVSAAAQEKLAAAKTKDATDIANYLKARLGKAEAKVEELEAAMGWLSSEEFLQFHVQEAPRQ